MADSELVQHEGNWIQGEDGEWYEEVEEWEEVEEALEEYDLNDAPQQIQPSVYGNPLPPTVGPLAQQIPQQLPQQLPQLIGAPQSISQTNWPQPINPSTSIQPVQNTQPIGVVKRTAGDALAPAQTIEEGEGIAKQLDRAYKFEDYEPKREGWLADVVTELFVSLFFKVYFGFFLFTSATLLGFFFINWICTTIYFAFSPPGASVPYIQSLGIIVAFFFLSVSMVSAICMWFDVVKIFVSHSRSEKEIWGVSHDQFPILASLCCCEGWCGDEDPPERKKQTATELEEKSSPWIVYLIFEILILPFPVLYSLISATSQGRSVLYFGQQLFYVTTITTCCLLAVLFAWFYILAYWRKREAFSQRDNDDSVRSVSVDMKGTEKKSSTHWYRSQIFLEEFGLDTITLRWSIVAILVGITPIFAINVAMALDGVDSNNNAGWVATVLVIFCGLLLIQQITESKRNYRAVFVTISFIAIFFILGIVGCAVTGSPASIAILVLPFLATQGTLLRKRDHVLTRKEKCVLLGIPLERNEDEGMQSSRIETFLCSGRNFFFACVSCFDVHTIFGYRHPKVVERERMLRRQNICLRSDYKVLMGFWGIIGIFYFFVILIGKVSVEHNETVVSAVGLGEKIEGVDPFSFCTTPILSVANHKKSLTIVDMAMFAMLSNSFGTDHDVDFATWFSDVPSIRRIYPSKNFFGESGIAWEHVVDSTTGVHIIIVRSSNRGIFWAQHMFTWGDALALQFASVIAPQINTWDLSDKQNIVKGLGILKKGFKSDWLPIAELEEYTQRVVSGLQGNSTVILLGSGFAGGYAKICAGRLGIPYVSFNAPGVELSWKQFGIQGYNDASIDIVSQNSLISSVDVQSKGGVLYTIPCGEKSASACSRTSNVLKTLLSRCGDDQGRRMNN